MLAPETLLQNRYRILESVGRGGMGEVYRAHDPRLDRIVAVKTLSQALTSDDSFIARFEHEARTVAGLSHAGIVPIYDVGQDQGIPFLVMKYIEAGSLADLIKRGDDLPLEQKVGILEQMAAAIDYAHGRGLVHRDVKPANILLGNNVEAYLTDFGLVKAEDINLTMPGQVMGTPAYMAPEQIVGEAISPATDIYSLGVVAYELLGGRAPFQGSMTSVFDGHVRREPPSLLELNPALPAAVEAVIRQALAKDPQLRPARATSFVAALRRSLAGSVTARPVGAGTATHMEPPAWAATPESTTPAPQATASPPSTPGGSPPAAEKSRASWLLGGLATALAMCVCSIVAVSGLGLLSWFQDDALLPTISGTAVADVAELSDVADVADVVDVVDATDLPSDAIATLQGVREATIQIEAQGSFVDPQVGVQMNVAGRGSGFIIDKSGIAVTNNHVVTGAALLRVYVAGESQPRNARVLGAAECSDLAVIQIEGDDFPYLDWYDGAIDVGLDIYAAGFPLGDPEYTLTRGVVSKARASGHTNWAALDSVLEHDATINPGSSGGPLVDPQGKLVGVNYAGSSTTNQYFAIGRDMAIPLIEQLREGHNVHSIGVNGVAVNNNQGLSGIWVASVKSGSPADRAGVRPGDIITAMEGLLLATDGTMGDYCSILRSRAAEDTITVQVLRYETAEVLEGQLNGRVLEPKFSFAQELDAQVDASTPTQDYGGYRTIHDDSQAIVMEVPDTWRDIDGSLWVDEGEVLGASIAASVNLDRFYTSWEEPGVFFAASRSLVAVIDEDALLDLFTFAESCTYEGRYDYLDALYTGAYDVWYDCGNVGTILVVMAVSPANRSFLGLMQVQVVSSADLDALDRIFDTFQVVGDLP
jgi:serine protease Do